MIYLQYRRHHYPDSQTSYSPICKSQISTRLLQALLDINDTDSDFVRGARRQNPPSHNEQMIWITQHSQVTCVRHSFRSRDRLPCTRVSKSLIDEDLRVGTGTNNDGSIFPSDRRPHRVRRPKWLDIVIGDNWGARRFQKLQWVGVDAVVDGEGISCAGVSGTTTIFLEHN